MKLKPGDVLCEEDLDYCFFVYINYIYNTAYRKKEYKARPEGLGSKDILLVWLYYSHLDFFVYPYKDHSFNNYFETQKISVNME